MCHHLKHLLSKTITMPQEYTKFTDRVKLLLHPGLCVKEIGDQLVIYADYEDDLHNFLLNLFIKNDTIIINNIECLLNIQ